MRKRKLLFVMIAVLGFALTTNAQVPSYVPANGLLAWWSLDNTPNDQSINGNHFANYGMTFTPDRFNNPNSAATGNGTSQYMLCNTPSFILGATSAFSISFWTRKPSVSYGVCLMHGSTAAGNFIWNFQTTASGEMQFGTNKQQSAWIWTQTTHSINLWDHFLATYNGGAITLYKNGVLAATNTFTHTSVTQTVLPIYLGRGVSGAYYTGAMDDVGMWDRALTLQEITGLYTGGCANSYSTVQATACDAYTWPQNNQAYSQSGLYNDTLMNYLGCDSVITLDLTIMNSTHATDVALACDTFTWINGITYGSSVDTPQFIIPNAVGCDSIITLDLTIIDLHFIQQPANAQATTGSNAVFSVATSPQLAMYRWQTDIGSGFQNLMDTGQYSGTYTSTLTISNLKVGNHAQPFRCITTIGDCKDTSQVAIITVTDIGMDEPDEIPSVTAFPNPVTDQLFLKSDAALTGAPFTLSDFTGRVVFTGVIVSETTTVLLDDIPSGVYLLNVGGTGKKPMRVIKI